MIIFESILNIYLSSIVLWVPGAAEKNWLELKIKPPFANLVCINQ
jgi:hypothetical protein